MTSALDNIILKANALIVNPLIILMFSFALIGFLWGVKDYIVNADDQEARAKGTQHMLWGLLGMLIMISTFTIMKIILQTFGLGTGETQTAVQKVIGN
ncbi:MAG: hypothetical protein WCF92_03070 [bacterium]